MYPFVYLKIAPASIDGLLWLCMLTSVIFFLDHVVPRYFKNFFEYLGTFYIFFKKIISTKKGGSSDLFLF